MSKTSKATTADQLIDERLHEARRALWWSELTRTVLAVSIGSMVAVLAWLVMDHWIYSPGPLARTICLVGLISVAVWILVKKAWPVLTSRVSDEYAAWSLEQDSTDFRGQLTSYVTLKPDAERGGVRTRVIRAIGTRAAMLLKKHDALPSEATGTFAWWIAAAGVFAVLAGYIVASPKSSLASAHRLVAPMADIAPAKRVQISNVVPGDTNALAGRSVDVSAQINGLRKKDSAWIVWASEGVTHRSEMKSDPTSDRFDGKIELEQSAGGTVPYTIEAGDATAGPFQLDVENVPVVAVERIFYQPPLYTGRPDRTTSSPAVSAIDGTRVRLTAKTNRPVTRAQLQFNPKSFGDQVSATAGINRMTVSEDGMTLTSEMILRSARGRSAAVELQSYRIRVWDADERSNPAPIVYPIQVIPDLPPEITIVVPKKSPIEVPVDAQQIIEIHAMDADFELQRVSLKIQRGLDTVAEPDVWRKFDDISGKGNQVTEYRFRPTEHGLRVGDVVRITATAEDNRSLPDPPMAQANRTSTDPLEIRIVESDPDVPEDPTGNDGLSQPDNQPASESNQSEGEKGGEGGSGSGQSDGGKSEGTSEDGSQGGGSSGTGEEQDPSGEQDSTSDKPQGNGDSADAEPSDSSGDTPQDSSGDPSGTGEPSQEMNPSEQTGEQSGEPGEGQDPGGDPNDAAGQDSANNQNDGTGQENQPNPNDGGNNDASDSKGDAPRNGGQNESGQNDGGNESSSPPKHDAEAFERIKDYLEKNQKQKQNQQGKSDQPKNQQKPDGGKSPQDGTKSTEGESPESGKDGQRSEDENPNQDSDPNRDSDPSGQNDPGDDGGKDPSQGKSPQDQSQSNKDSQTSDDSGKNDSTDPPSTSQDSQPSDMGKDREGDPPESPQSDGSDDNPSAPDSQKGTGSKDDPSGKGTEDSEPNDAQSDDPKSSEGGQDDPNGGQGTPDKQDQGNPSGGDPSDDAEPNGDPSEKDPPSDNQKGDNSANNGPDSQPTPGAPSNPNPSGNPKPSDGGDGGGSGTTETGEDLNEPPPPPDLEYTKKATDMVLDYLDETRDQVDDELLNDLDWTEDDLRRFRDRWEKVRDLEQTQPTGEKQNELEDALRSLGMRPESKTRNAASGSADSLQDVKDSGNRRRAPTAFRDLFDAFRRSSGK